MRTWISRLRKPNKHPTKWMKKKCDIHTMEYYSAIKNHEIMLSAATMLDLEIILRWEETNMLSQAYLKYE